MRRARIRRGLILAAASVLVAAATGHGAPENIQAPEKSEPAYATRPIIPEDMIEVAQQASDLFGTQNFGEAAKAYLYILDRHPQSLYAWSNLAVARFMEKDYPKAEEALRRAIKLAPKDAVSRELLSIVLYQQKKFFEAEAEARAAIKHDGRSVGAHRALAMSLASQGRMSQAREVIMVGLELDPRNAELLSLRELIDADGTAQPPVKNVIVP